MTDSTTTLPEPEAADAPDYPMHRAAGCPFDPPPGLRSLQAEEPLTRVRLWDGSTPWLVTGHAQQRSLLADPRISADTTHPHYPHQTEAVKARQAERTFISMDDPDHARLRRMVTASFTVKRVKALRPAVQRVVDGLIDDLLAGPSQADLVKEFALPVPSLVICALLGVPYADHDFFQRNSRLLISRDSSPADSVAAQEALVGYLERLVGEKLDRPEDDLLSELAVRHVATGQLSAREAGLMGQLLLVAGHETTANMISLGTLALLQNPGQFAELRETQDPQLVAGAVEELLRYLTIVHTGRRRVALADIEVGGRTIRAGEGVVIASDIGNRDETVFPDPDRLDIHRDARRHMAFGFGVHQCLGQPLARLELEVVYSTLYRRVPTLRLATGLDGVPFKHDALVYGVHELPVAW
ncbi:cytochrome P450 [Streptomyces sp. IBSBF 2435]|uniref:cytochrome P450 n=1 Tax=Streptomyces sp. IBSBF 2435 TaxID=2903531 RepID=UPI002FDC0EBB